MLCRFKQRLEGGSPTAQAEAHATKSMSSAKDLQIKLAEALREACKGSRLLALCTLRVLLTSTHLRKAAVASALQVWHKSSIWIR